ncbi:MAG TPA: hypothetical protein VJH88_02765 [Candidatus Nanoarchaeia archaeon]|nr:hypothetical protein [Candidatus Nanoarchaeia archaeon]
MSNKEIIRLNGIIHFWDLPEYMLVILKSDFKIKLFDELMYQAKTIYRANKLTSIARSSLSSYLFKEMPKISISSLLKVLKAISTFNLGTVEENIIWIGGNTSPGISSPKLPFDFNSRSAVHLIAAICNDGWISANMCYSNSNQKLRQSVKKDAVLVFGGDERIISENIKGNDKFLLFPSVMREAILLLADFRGIKSENNPSIPLFIMKNKEFMCGWIEQTIADEGCVKHYPQTYRRELNWSRAFQKSLSRYNLIENEKAMLDVLGIQYEIYKIGEYKTIQNIDKVRYAIRIAKRENLLKFRELIIIPGTIKDQIFTALTKTFMRYKEKIIIKEKVLSLCKIHGSIDSRLLKESMNYKNTNCALRWLKFYEKQGKLVKGKVSSNYTLASQDI